MSEAAPVLIEPVRHGADLAAEIREEAPAPGHLIVWWLGQSGFVIKSRAGTLVIDPYLSESLTTKYAGTSKPHVRMTRCPLRPDELGGAGVDLILASHKHSDHLDPGTLPNLLRSAPGALLHVPDTLVDHANGLGLPADRVRGIEAGESIEFAGFRVWAVPSAHETLDVDSVGRHPYLGFIVESEGLRLYHTGDSMLYEGLEAWLGPGPFNAMFLPINGRDPSRGVAGNMSSADAIALASALRPRYIVPHHYDMFTFNTAPVSEFEAEATALPPGVLPKVLRCGELWELTP